MIKKNILIASSLLAISCGVEQTRTGETPHSMPEKTEQSSPTKERKTVFEYPQARKGDVVDNYHGAEVTDPYRWLEQDVGTADEVARWVEAQNLVTFDYLKSLPGRASIEKRLTALWDYEKFGTPFKRGGRYYFYKNDGLQNQYVLHVQDDLESEPRVLIDPNTWSDDGTVALGETSPSPDGRYFAYSIQDGGSDWRTWKIKDMMTGEDLDDKLEWVKFSNVSWLPDGSGLFYGRYQKPEAGAELQSLNLNMQVYFHKVGTDQSDDELVFEKQDQPEWTFGNSVTDDGHWLVVTSSTGTDFRNRVFVKNLKAESEFVTIVDDFNVGYSLLGNEGARLYFLTTDDAPNRRIIAVDMDNGGAISEVVAQTDNVAQTMSYIGGRFVVEYLKDAKSLVTVYSVNGEKLYDVTLPGIGSVGAISGNADEDEMFFSFSSFNAPQTIYRADVKTGESKIFKSSNVDFNPDDYTVSQVFYPSKDGTQVPMFVAHKKGLDISKGVPTLLYSYGGFNVSLTPGFSVGRLAWMEMGGIFALANIRGGGEYGEKWHKAGTKLNKQNVFDDFIAAGEYLIENGYTTKQKLSVQGGSNGGLLVGAVVNQRPDLFGAALPAVGVMDMLRFQNFTAGRFWVDDYGSSENKEEFQALYAYSPYHNLKPRDYPAVLVTTADRDDRVVPGHSFKYAARLQEMQQGSTPVMIRIETRAGHGAGKPTEKIIEELADEWAFLKQHLGLELPENYGQ